MSAVSTPTRPAIVCPDWCTLTDHVDADRPGGVSGEDYDREYARGEHDGCYIHRSELRTAAGVRLSTSTDRHGAPVPDDEPVIFVDGGELTLDQAREVARVLDELVDAHTLATREAWDFIGTMVAEIDMTVDQAIAAAGVDAVRSMADLKKVAQWFGTYSVEFFQQPLVVESPPRVRREPSALPRG
jgi:hypothetical protein